MDENAIYILMLLFEKEHGTRPMVGLKKIQDARDINVRAALARPDPMVGLKKIQDARDWVLEMAGIQYEIDARADEATKDD